MYGDPDVDEPDYDEIAAEGRDAQDEYRDEPIVPTLDGTHGTQFLVRDRLTGLAEVLSISRYATRVEGARRRGHSVDDQIWVLPHDDVTRVVPAYAVVYPTDREDELRLWSVEIIEKGAPAGEIVAAALLPESVAASREALQVSVREYADRAAAVRK